MRLLGLALAAALLITGPALAAGKEPPSCAALTFKPLQSGAPEGEQNAGMYKSRFGRVEIKADVKNGTAQNYYMVLNGKRPTSLTGAVPKHVEACLKTKNVAVPYKSQGATACTGERFRVVMDRSGKEPITMLFGLQGKEWAFCDATVA